MLNQRACSVHRESNSAAGSVDESACMKCAPGKYNSMAGSDAEAQCKECDGKVQQCGWRQLNQHARTVHLDGTTITLEFTYASSALGKYNYETGGVNQHA